MSADPVVLLRSTHCCGCGGPLPQDGELSLIQLDKRAEWRFPVWTNVLVRGAGDRAIAVECAYCLHEGVPPKTAVEIREDDAVVHHPVAALADVPEITEAELPR